MPVLGKDYQPKKKEEQEEPEKPEEPVIKREIKVVKAYLVHPSITLPERERSQEVINSVKKGGAQQPIIVRPHPEMEGHYEIIDGWNRYLGIVGEAPNILLYNDVTAPDIQVDIRYDLTKSQVLRLADNLHKRQDRKTYEQAAFDVKRIEAKAEELGKKEGAITEVAKEMVADSTSIDTKKFPYLYKQKLNAKQSILSQYCKIYELFNKLERENPDKNFNKLKSLSINKLYELTKLMDNMPVLIKVVEKLKKNPDMTIERLRKLVGGDITERKTEWRPMFKIKEYLAHKFKNALNKCDPRMFKIGKDTGEIMKRSNKCLINFFIANFEMFKPEFEKDLREGGYKLARFRLKTPIEREDKEHT